MADFNQNLFKAGRLVPVLMMLTSHVAGENSSSTCPPGRYGATCSQLCHVNCFTCMDSGLCDTCNDTSVYGPLCNQNCNFCRNSTCNRYRCADGCDDGWYEIQSQKLQGQPDSYLCKRCPKACTRCISDTSCTSCIHRRWDVECSKRCAKGCKRCNKHSGICLVSRCDQGLYLDAYGQCNSCPRNCLSCLSEYACTECVGYRYGSTCTHINCTSISHCMECTCDTDCSDATLRCIRCDYGYSGTLCQINCGDDCGLSSSESVETDPETEQNMSDDAFTTRKLSRRTNAQYKVADTGQTLAKIIMIGSMIIIFSYPLIYVTKHSVSYLKSTGYVNRNTHFANSKVHTI